MFWNHRIVEVTERCLDDDEKVLVFAEVYYHEVTRKPYAWHEPFMHGDSLDEMRATAARLLDACLLPVLKASDIDPPVAAPEHLLPWIALNHWLDPHIVTTASIVDEAVMTMRDI